MTIKLRHKFVVITMSIVTVILFIIMFLICYFTKMDLENRSIDMMPNIADRPFLPQVPNEFPENVRLPYFTLKLSLQGNLVATGGGYYDLSDEAFLKDLIKATFSGSDHIGIIDEYNLRFYRTSTSASQILVYTDISNELRILSSLERNCSLIGQACFLIFLCISLFLANWVASPIDKAWNQQRQFIADASHELKTPLAVIMTNAELMQSSDYDEESRSTFASNILIKSRQMRNLVEQILELARADTVQDNTVFSSVDFSRLISDAILPFEPIFFERGLTLRTEISEGITVNGDASQLRQVLEILLDNAQKYSRKNGTTWVTLQRHGKGHCLLAVADEGEKISADDLEYLFKRFYRADKARSRTDSTGQADGLGQTSSFGQTGSFGLGLSIAETIITRHKGKIWAESQNNINTFYVEMGRNL